MTACGQLQQFRDLSDIDCTPPVFHEFTQATADTLVFVFNEPVRAENTELTILPADFIYSYQIEDCTVIVSFSEPAVPGKEYALEASISDFSGNSLYMLYPFYGFNNNLPKIQINEFTCQGSSSHPDLVELKVTADGNIAGMALFEGTAQLFDDYFIFPSCTVEAGEFILIHFKPEGIPEEQDELEDINVSEGIDASATARDFWVVNGGGLGGNNGALCLYSNPGGEILDAVLYSNRTSASDTKYRGFGSTKFMNQVDTVFNAQAWKAEEEEIKPEDCINPEDSTSTRSICRSNAADTNNKTDWYIVDTSEYSFGEENSTVVYEK